MLAKLKRLCLPNGYPRGGGGDDGGSSAPPATTTATQVKEIPAWAQPSAQNLLARGESLSNQPYQQYSGERVAGLDPYQQQGFGQIANMATYGTPGQAESFGNYQDTMSGAYLSPDSNPYLQGMVNTALDNVQTRVNSQFGGSNYGTTAHQETLAKSLGDVANQAYGQNYANERMNQMRGQTLAPQMNAMAYGNAQQLVGIGDIYRQEAQDKLNIGFNDWQQAQNQPYRQLDVLANALGAAVGGQGNVSSAGYQTNPYTTNRYANAVGGALAGGSIGSLFNSADNPNASLWGAGLGAAGGLLGA